MKNLKELKEERATLKKKAQALIDDAEQEKREMNPEEEKNFDSYSSQIEDLNAKIERAQKIENLKREEIQKEIQRQKPEGGEKKEFRELVMGFSVGNLVKQQMEERSLNGIEAEVSQEMRSLHGASGVKSTPGASVIPFWALADQKGRKAFLDSLEGRAVSMTDNADSVSGGFGGVIEALQPASAIFKMGAQIQTGLQGKVTYPRTIAGTMAWRGEKSAVADSGMDMDGITLDPKAISGYVDFYREFLAQAPYVVENAVRTDFTLALARAIDAAAIDGNGTTAPEGILTNSNVPVVAMGTNGDAITWAKVLELIATGVDNGMQLDMAGFISSGTGMSILKSKSKDTGSGRFIWDENGIDGLRAAVSAAVPNDLTKGSGTALTALLLGAWNELLIGQWGGVEIVYDPYTGSKNGYASWVLNAFLDIKPRNDKSFAVIKDITTS